MRSGNAAAHEVGSFFEEAVIKFLVALTEAAQVDVEIVNRGLGLFLEEMGEFQGIHAANARAVLMIIFIPTTYTVDNSHRLRFGAVFQ